MSTANRDEHTFPWGHHRRFNAYPNYFRKLYGARVQKLSIDAGFTCPNRDGTRGSGGCSYCLNDAFNPSYCIPSKSISQQLEEGAEFHRWRYSGAVSYLAYFQAFSNTYAPLDHLKKLYSEALEHPGVIGIIIGTRPDCIDDEKLSYLEELSQNHYVAVEYGIESCYDRTLARINRGHSFGEALAAVEKTAGRGINTGAHFIFGLPGESMEEMLTEAGIISAMPLTTVKFHQLQIMKGTAMEREYIERSHEFELFTLEEYIGFFIKFLEKLNPAIVVERFTGEAPPRYMSMTPWGKMRADQVTTMIEKRLEELDTWQGRRYRPS
jgi:radical SAM protein (TIGR01212 family)